MNNPYRAFVEGVPGNAPRGLAIGIFINILFFVPFIYVYSQIVPKFHKMFVELGVLLPGVSVLVIHVSQATQSFLLPIIIIYGCVAIYVIKNRNSNYRYLSKILWIHAIVILLGLCLAPVGIFLPIMAMQENLK